MVNITPGQCLQQVIRQLDRIYGDPEKRKPITVSQLKLKATVSKITREIKVFIWGAINHFI